MAPSPQPAALPSACFLQTLNDRRNVLMTVQAMLQEKMAAQQARA